MSKVPPRAVVLRRNPKKLRILWLPALMALMGLFSAATGALWSGLTNVATGLALLFSFGTRAWSLNEEPRREDVPLEVGENTLRIGHDRHAIDQIGAGYRLGTHRVRLHLGERRLSTDLEFASAEDADAFLEGLQLGPQQRVATFPAVAATPSSVWGWLVRLGPVFVALASYLLAGMSAVWLPMILLVMVLSLWRRNVHVGSDGVRTERGLLWSRFVPHEAIEGTRIVEPKRRRDGLNVVIDTAEGEHRVGFRSRDEADAFRARIEAAAVSDDGTPSAESLARGDDDVGAWVARLRASTHLGTPRRGAMTEGKLWRIVEATSQPPVERAAAAIALSPTLDERRRARVLDVAAATASPRLRVVLDAAGRGEDDEALTEALAELLAAEGVADRRSRR